MQTSLDNRQTISAAAAPATAPARTNYPVLGAISFSHLHNDMIKS